MFLNHHVLPFTAGHNIVIIVTQCFIPCKSLFHFICPFVSLRIAGGNITRALIQGASYIHVNQLTKALGTGGGGNAGGSGDDKPGGGGQEAPDPAA